MGFTLRFINNYGNEKVKEILATPMNHKEPRKMRGFFFALKNKFTCADTMHTFPINLFHKPKGLRQDNPTFTFFNTFFYVLY